MILLNKLNHYTFINEILPLMLKERSKIIQSSQIALTASYYPKWELSYKKRVG